MDISQKAGYKEPTMRVTSNGKEARQTLVVSSPPNVSGIENAIYEHPSTPKYGDVYPYDPSIVVTSVDIAQAVDNNFVQWEVEVTYSALETDNGGGGSQGFERNLQVIPRTQQYEVPFEAGYDKDNKQYAEAGDEENGVKKGDILIPVVSTSNEPLLVSKYNANMIFDISQNMSRFEYEWIKELKNSTNAKKSKIVGMDVDVDKARIVEMTSSAKQTDETGQDYYTVTVSVEITETDFKIKPSNKGRYKKDPDSQSNFAVLDILESDIRDLREGETDQPVAEAVRLKKDNTPYTNSETGATYLEFKAYPSLDWGVLDLPTFQP